MDLNQLWSEFLNQLSAEAEAAGRDALDAGTDVAEYAAQRAEHLAQFEPGNTPNYGELVEAELRNVGMRAGIVAAEQGDAVDARINGILQGALQFAANAARAIT